MAMIRKPIGMICWLAALLLTAQLGCRPPAVANPRDLAKVTFESHPRRPGLDTVIVFAPANRTSKEVVDTLADELHDDFDLVAVDVTPEMTPERLIAEIKSTNPKSVILMNNPTVGLYRRVQQQDAIVAKIPVFIAMSSFVSELIKPIKNAVGLAYEVPVLLSMVQMREYLDRPIRRVGVVHRQAFSRYVSAQGAMAQVEQIEVVAKSLGNDPTAEELADALEALVEAEGVDALWILNDNRLLTPDLMRGPWLDVTRNSKIPIVVGVPSLVRGDVHIGSFGILADPVSLGAQLGNELYDLADTDWVLDSGRVEQPVGVKSIVAVKHARKYLDFREETLGRIDVVIE